MRQLLMADTRGASRFNSWMSMFLSIAMYIHSPSLPGTLGYDGKEQGSHGPRRPVSLGCRHAMHEIPGAYVLPQPPSLCQVDTLSERS